MAHCPVVPCRCGAVSVVPLRNIPTVDGKVAGKVCGASAHFVCVVTASYTQQHICIKKLERDLPLLSLELS